MYSPNSASSRLWYGECGVCGVLRLITVRNTFFHDQECRFWWSNLIWKSSHGSMFDLRFFQTVFLTSFDTSWNALARALYLTVPDEYHGYSCKLRFRLKKDSRHQRPQQARDPHSAESCPPIAQASDALLPSSPYLGLQGLRDASR